MKFAKSYIAYLVIMQAIFCNAGTEKTLSPTGLVIRSTPVPTLVPSDPPSPVPTDEPTPSPSPVPTDEPTPSPTPAPTDEPTPIPTDIPTAYPTANATDTVGTFRTVSPTAASGLRGRGGSEDDGQGSNDATLAITNP